MESVIYALAFWLTALFIVQLITMPKGGGCIRSPKPLGPEPKTPEPDD